MASSRRRWKSWALEEGVGLGIALHRRSSGPATPTRTVVSSFQLRRTWRRQHATRSVGFATLCHSADVGSSGSSPECVVSSPIQPRSRTASFSDETSDFEVAGFLRSCHLCRKNLDGKDIYMYRGEKAFCSAECRYQQMRSDEKVESNCAAEAPRPSAGTGGRLFYHGVQAA